MILLGFIVITMQSKFVIINCISKFIFVQNIYSFLSFSSTQFVSELSRFSVSAFSRFLFKLMNGVCCKVVSKQHNSKRSDRWRGFQAMTLCVFRPAEVLANIKAYIKVSLQNVQNLIKCHDSLFLFVSHLRFSAVPMWW